MGWSFLTRHCLVLHDFFDISFLDLLNVCCVQNSWYYWSLLKVLFIYHISDFDLVLAYTIDQYFSPVVQHNIIAFLGLDFGVFHCDCKRIGFNLLLFRFFKASTIGHGRLVNG